METAAPQRTDCIHFQIANAYIALCHHYGWTISWAGLAAFARGERARLLIPQKERLY